MNMDVSQENNLFIDNLTDEERKTIEKIARHLSNLSRLKGNGDQISKTDDIRLRRVVHAYKAFKNSQLCSDVVDGEMISSSSVKYQNFISPSRFLVELSEETRFIVHNVNEMIQECKRNSLSQNNDISKMYTLPAKSLIEKRKQEEVWKQRGKVVWWSLISAFLAPLTYLIDIGTDLNLARSHFYKGDTWWGTLTLMLVILPSIFINLMSYFFYVNDEEKVKRKPESGWRAVKIAHVLQLGLIERYWRIIAQRFKTKSQKFSHVTPFKLNIAMNLDTAMLQMILAFTEDAPQLVLQLYVLIRQYRVEHLISMNAQNIKTLAAICCSFISYSLALTNYQNALRDSKADKGELGWHGFAAVLFWRAFMIVSRVFVLVFFATEFHLWFFFVLCLHFVVVLVLIWKQEMKFFSENNNSNSITVKSLMFSNNTKNINNIDNNCTTDTITTTNNNTTNTNTITANTTSINIDNNIADTNICTDRSTTSLTSNTATVDANITGNTSCIISNTNDIICANIKTHSNIAKSSSNIDRDISSNINFKTSDSTNTTAKVTSANTDSIIITNLNASAHSFNNNDDSEHNDDDHNLHNRLQMFTRVIIAYMHIFSFFVLEASKLLSWAVKYYLLIGLEAVVFSSVWFTNTTSYVSYKLEISGISVIFLSFGIGLLVMVVYYKCLHPTLANPHEKTIPLAYLCENMTNKDEKEECDRDDFDLGIHSPKNRASSIVRKVMSLVPSNSYN